MLKIIAIAFFFVSISAFSSVSSGCKQCMAECPHMTRDLKSCDRGCPDSCTKSELDELKGNQQAKKNDATIPPACGQCMSQCPHNTRDLKPCDRGCTESCSKAQALEWRAMQEKKKLGNSCYDCMSQCPHATRDLKPCDRGCTEQCDIESLRDAFLKLNAKKNKSCGAAGESSSGSGSIDAI